MSTISQCPSCGQHFQIPATLVAPEVRCPTCGQELQLPNVCRPPEPPVGPDQHWPIVLEPPFICDSRIGRVRQLKRRRWPTMAMIAACATTIVIGGTIYLLRPQNSVKPVAQGPTPAVTESPSTSSPSTLSDARPVDAAQPSEPPFTQAQSKTTAPPSASGHQPPPLSPQKTIEADRTVPAERPIKKVIPIDVLGELAKAGYDVGGIERLSAIDVQHEWLMRWHLYGSYKDSVTAMSGSQFDRMEFKERNKRPPSHFLTHFALRNLQISVAPRDDFHERGLLVSTEVGLWLESSYDRQQPTRLSPNLRRLVASHPSNDFWALEKSGNSVIRLRTRDELQFARNNGGVVYIGMGIHTLVGAWLKLDTSRAKDIHENPDNYRMTVIFDGLMASQAKLWGCYREDALRDAEFDGDEVTWDYVFRYLSKPDGRAPPVFRFDDATAPDVLFAMLKAVYVHTADGKVIASYVGGSSLQYEPEFVSPVRPVQGLARTLSPAIPRPSQLPEKNIGLTRRPIPDAEALADAQRRLMPDLIVRGLERAEPSTINERARQVFAMVQEFTDDPAAQYFLAEHANSMFINTKDVPSALSTLSWMTQAFEIDNLAKRIDVLQKLSRKELDQEPAQSVLSELRESHRDASELGRFDMAARALSASSALARKRSDWILVKELEQEQKRLDALRRKSNFK